MEIGNTYFLVTTTRAYLTAKLANITPTGWFNIVDRHGVIHSIAPETVVSFEAK